MRAVAGHVVGAVIREGDRRAAVVGLGLHLAAREVGVVLTGLHRSRGILVEDVVQPPGGVVAVDRLADEAGAGEACHLGQLAVGQPTGAGRVDGAAGRPSAELKAVVGVVGRGHVAAGRVGHLRDVAALVVAVRQGQAEDVGLRHQAVVLVVAGGDRAVLVGGGQAVAGIVGRLPLVSLDLRQSISENWQ